jgi:aminomethyltransferase
MISSKIPGNFVANTQLKMSPFFERTSKINTSQEWKRWGGFLAATKYDLCHDNEYFAIRTKAGLLDISPLYKYRIKGKDSIFFINRLVTRDISICEVGQVMYSPWCDENGKVIDDGTIQRLGKEDFRLTSAEPNLSWLELNSYGLNIKIYDESDKISALALQGPNSREIINSISSKSINNLKYFRITNTDLNGINVSISRTGYTGDLGYEIWIDPKNALTVWDILLEKGKSFGITPTGLHALDISRIEAGLILLDVDYISSRHAIIESRKSSPYELGLGWAVKMNKNNFIGKKSLEKEIARGPDWEFIGIEIEWDQLEKLYREVGLAPGLPSTAWRSSTSLYYNDQQVGYATSGTWSPILKRYIALAHVKSNFAMVGTALDFEIKIEHFRKLTKAKVVNTPFFDPARKRSCPK